MNIEPHIKLMVDGKIVFITREEAQQFAEEIAENQLAIIDELPRTI